MLNMGKEGIVIHTSKDLYNTHHKNYTNTEKDILKFWSTIDFVKGIFFDVDQRTLQDDGINSDYEIFPHLNYPYDDHYICNLSKHINFSFFPKRFTEKINSSDKIAVFQPISLKNKPKHLVADFVATWNKSVGELINKNYHIYLIGSSDDYFEAKKIYGDKFTEEIVSPQITNLMGKLDMFEAIDLVMNKADFVLSCCSWAGWYGIASRKKTAMALGPLMEEGGIDKRHTDLIKNKDVFFVDYSSKKDKADNNIANWIQRNA